MNQHLQTILTIIQQEESLSAEQKTAVLKSLKDAGKELEIAAFKLDRTEKVKRTTAILLEETIEELEQKRAAVEAQNHELEIESSLERVRTVAMGMNKPGDLLNICETMFCELKKLDFADLRNAMIDIHYDEEAYLLNYDYSEVPGKTVTKFIYNSHPIVDNLIYHSKISREGFTEMIYSGKELQEWRAFRKVNGEEDDHRLDEIDALYYYFYSIGAGAVGISLFKAANREQLDVLKRFRNVFELAYRRYVDITNAEAQAREAKIEAALERVRSRTMAMHHSNELAETSSVLFQQIKDLGFETWSCGFCIWTNDDMAELWMGADSGGLLPPMLIPYKDEPTHRNIFEAFLQNKPSHHKIWEGEALQKHYQFLETIPSVKTAIEQLKNAGLSLPSKQCYYVGFFKQGYLLLITKEPDPALEDLSKRFASVFDLTYTRFLDLKKAEAQAKEAQIEAALEKVRSRSLAIHKSDDLKEVVTVLFEKLKELQIPITAAGITLFIDGSKDMNIYVFGQNDEGLVINNYWLSYFNHPICNDFHTAREKHLDFFVGNYSKEEKDSFYEYVLEHTTLRDLPNDIKEMIFQSRKYSISMATVNNSMIAINDFEGKGLGENEIDIIKKFARVFEQAYIRFLDLQKAEAQAKEAQIEAALERVRSRSMGMQKSEELKDIIQVVYDQLIHLNILVEHAGFIMDYKERDDMHIWLADQHAVPSQITIPYFDSPHWNSFIEAKEKGLDFFTNQLNFDQKNAFYKDLFALFPVPEEAKAYYFNCPGLAISTVLLENVGLYIENFSGIAYNDEENATLMRFGRVFQQTYQRFLDLQKAEAQTREAKIETALERVRSRSLAMHSSQELRDVVAILFQQLKMLQVDFDGGALIYLFSEGSKDAVILVASPELSLPIEVKLPYDEEAFVNNPIILDVWMAKETGKNIFNKQYSLEEKNKYFQYIFKNNDLQTIPQSARDIVIDADSYTASSIAEKNSLLGVNSWSQQVLPEKDFDILTRFSKAFEQAYIRFLDLKKAEANVREANIEASLERVRSRSLAMHQSTELKEVVAILFQQFKTLGVDFDGGDAIHLFSEESKDARILVASPELTLPIEVNLPYDEEAFINNPIIQDVWAAKETGQNICNKQYSLHEKNKYFQYVFKHNDLQTIPQSSRNLIVLATSYTASFVAEKNSLLGVNSWSHQILSEKEFDVLIRFARVFDQAYVRFLDLQKAEAQTRESQIQLGLERVRARAMAMQKSNELADLVNTVFKELTKLDFALTHCFIQIFEAETQSMRIWQANSETPDKPLLSFIQYHEHPAYLAILKAWKNRDVKWTYELKGSEKKSWDEFLFNETDYINLPLPVKEGMRKLDRTLFSGSFNNFGALQTAGVQALSEKQMEILLRFAKVFDLTYTRFHDLQKAEAQAREAQIETALEKVRSRTMAMRHSSELSETATVLFGQLKQLGAELWTCGFALCEPENVMVEKWMGSPITGHAFRQFVMPYTADNGEQSMYDTWKNGIDLYTYIQEGEELKRIYEELMNIPSFRENYKELLESGISFPVWQKFYIASYKYGYLLIITTSLFKEEQIFPRFAKVFEQTYTRFLDLQKAEAQTKEAQIETALERVRSRTLAMQKSEELAETSAVLFKQLILLGIEPNRLYINIIKSESGEAEFWITDEEGSKVSSAFESNMNDNASFKEMFDGWKNNRKSLVMDMKGEELQQYFQHLGRLHVPFKNGLQQQRRLQYIAYFNKGFIGMASPDEQPIETMLLLERFASVFNLTFTRFNDLKMAEAHAVQAEEDLIKLQTEKRRAEDALTELQLTQKQLIQSEKMASLGELTAGIAHEIQNPLNFVNNFSEVSNELLDEMMEEVAKGNYEEVKAIADDVKQNLAKIHHHGRRADVIVKGMLQHSRSSSATKEPTDINALTDEYLRLAYHGLRAKDKSFNATLQTDYDLAIGNINIIPQDIGRVILNLITNAFYAVGERKKQSGISYEPKVSIATKKFTDRIEVRVQDNGGGIPKHIVDKIFQPFFTTKPTGQGTGLGLSLAYDIVKAHGGEIKVETKENEGSVFTITLPKH